MKNSKLTSFHRGGAILYDFFEVRGGAEAVTLQIAEATGATIYVDFVGENYTGNSELAHYDVVTLGRPAGRVVKTISGLIRFYSRRHLLDDRPWVIYSGNNTLAAVFHTKTNSILYCHTPPRFAFDLYPFYFNQLSVWQKPLFYLFAKTMRNIYAAAVRRMDLVYANSENTANRLRKYVGVEVEVLYPPVETGSFKWLGQGGYYLSTARCEPYKRVELIVDAFATMPEKKLVVTSGGSQLEYLMNKARNAKNIEFTDWVDSEVIQSLVGNCIATIYVPYDEDFGMSPVESMAAGKPVIGVAEGGLLETIDDGTTGILIPPEKLSATKLAESISRLSPDVAYGMRTECENRARKYSRDKFAASLQSILGKL